MAELEALVGTALDAAAPGEDVEAYASSARRTEVKARRGRVDSLSNSETRGLGVRVIRDGRLGYAWAADPSAEEAAALVAAARESASAASPDEANVLPDPAPFEQLDGLFRQALVDMDPERKVELALDLERAAISSRPEVTKVEDAIYADAATRVAIGSSRGLAAGYERTDCWCMVVSLAEQGDETQTGFSFARAREPGELDWEGAAVEAAERGARLLGGSKPKTERLPVVLDPWAAASFLGVLVAALSAEEVQKGRSLFADLVGEEVAASRVTIADDGRLPDGPGSQPFDDEGVPTGRTPLIEAGVLRGFLHNTATARRAGAASTGNAGRAGYRGVPGVAPHNLFIERGAEEPAALLGSAGRAVYVQEVTGVHSGANPVSGEFSVGATGLRVDGGALGEPLREMTIASTIQEMLRAVASIGSDLRFRGGSVGSPTLLLSEMSVAGA